MKQKHLVLVGSTLLTSALAFAHGDDGAYRRHHDNWGRRGRAGITECTTVAPSTTAPSPTPTATSSPAPTGTPTTSPSPSPTPSATIFPLPSPSASPVASPSPIATDMAPLASAATAAGTTATTPDPTATDPSTSRYKILFSHERFNNGMIAADTFLLDSQGRLVKQVGHSELSAPAAGTATQGQSQQQAQAQVQSPQDDEDQMGVEYKSDTSSPFPFDLTITTGGDGRREVQLVSAGLFTGDTLSNLELRCR